MAKLSAPPPQTCQQAKSLSVALLKQRGLLQPGHWYVYLSWTTGGRPAGSIGLESIISPGGESYLLLSYTLAGGQAQEYRVALVRAASNLPGSTASRYYLVCPVSGRRASILYLRAGTERFAHRLAYPGKRFYYDSQLEQKRFRGLGKNAQMDREWERQYQRKYRKTSYAGKETKWLTALEVKTLLARITTARAILRLGY